MIHTTRSPRRRRRARAHAFPFGNVFQYNPEIRTAEKKNNFTNPAANVLEFEDRFILDLAVPGYKKEEISIRVDDHTLIIASEKEVSDSDKYTRREFAYGSFTRQFHLPEDVDAEKINASFSEGILNIVIPKKEEVMPKKIQVQ